MFVGPVFTREAVTAPRRTRLYASRAAYVAVLLLLLSTAWQVLTGTQVVRNVGDLGRFGAVVFQVLAPLQLTLAVFFSALSAAIAVSQEKDRRTLVLLLLTNLSNSELVLGKLLASLLGVLMLVAAALPMFLITALLGGIAPGQIMRAMLVTVASVLVSGSLGSTLALWREKTFQTLALSVLLLVLWTVGWEAVAHGLLRAGPDRLAGEALAAGFSPWHAMLEAVRPIPRETPALGWLRSPVNLFLVVSSCAFVLLNGVAIWRVRAWNSAVGERREVREDKERKPVAEETVATAAVSKVVAAPQSSRVVWDNPVLWREVCTWAYGRRILMVRIAYLLMFAAAGASLYGVVHSGESLSRSVLALPLIPVCVLSLLLINAQAVTSLTSERDTGALDLLLVTDITAKEFVFGKLAGVLYNTKEMVLLPMGLVAYAWFEGGVTSENFTYLLGGWIVLVCFAAMLGFHAGMTYANSRSAISVSLGTLFFLVAGVAVTMRIIFAFSGSFGFQLQPFLASMVGGGIGLYIALGARNPSPAILAASFLLPVATFYALTSFILEYTLAVFLVVAATYGFTTAAMLVPALFEFDVETGRTSGGEE